MAAYRGQAGPCRTIRLKCVRIICNGAFYDVPVRRAIRSATVYAQHEERGNLRMARPVAGLYDRVRHLIPELAKFGVVGCIGAVIDLGGAAVLHGSYHVGPLTAKAISIGAATVVTYVGSRFWTFRHRENQPLLREGVLFIALNVVGLIIAEAVIASTTYVLGYKDPIAYNIASLVGTGLGTIFRYFAYRQWVFLAPALEPAVTERAPVAAGASHGPAAASHGPGAASHGPAGWEPVRLPGNSMPNETAAPPLVTAGRHRKPPG